MRFRTRLILTYSIIVIALIFVLMLLFRHYNVQQVEESSKRDLEMISQAVSYQLEEMVTPMIFIGDFLLSDMKTLSAINTLSQAERSGVAQLYIMQAKRDIQASLSTYCVNKNFYKVNVFSDSGDLVSSGQISNINNPSTLLIQFPHLDKVNAAMGKNILLTPHTDTWDIETSKTVISLIRSVRGGTTSCYIEVQKDFAALEEFFSLYAAGNNRIAIVSRDGDVFFSQLSGSQNAYLSNTVIHESSQTADPSIIAQKLTQFDGSLASVEYSSYTDMYIIAAQGRDVFYNAVSSNTLFTAAIFALICVISIAFIYITSMKLAAPLRKLTKQMEQTTLDNIEDKIIVEHPSNEIETLSKAYNHLMERLNQAAFREKQTGMLQIQTHFDALQAQVNPHFIFNVLNMISSYGLVNGSETVCNICDKLAGMLRYSTATSQRVVTIASELTYVRQYLFLLQIRYENKLNCSIETDSCIHQQFIPKIVLQQIIENAVNHGFNDHSGEMIINLKGWTEKGYWIVRISDNGSGFSETSLQLLRKKTEEIQGLILKVDWQREIEIGGMGLINAFARMRLLMGEDFIFRFYNKDGEESGAIVEIGAKMNSEVIK